MDQTTDSPALRLSDFLPYRLSVLSNSVSRQIADRYQAEFGLTVWQWRVMAVLGETPGLTATGICDRTAMDKVAVSRAVAGLVSADMILRQATQDDGRRSHLYLSDRGLAVYRQIVPIAKSYESDLTAAMSDEDIEVLKALLDRCAGVVSPDRPLW